MNIKKPLMYGINKTKTMQSIENTAINQYKTPSPKNWKDTIQMYKMVSDHERKGAIQVTCYENVWVTMEISRKYICCGNSNDLFGIELIRFEVVVCYSDWKKKSQV